MATAIWPGLSPSPIGVVVAVWPDGRILRAKVASDPGKGHVSGRLSEAQLARLNRVVSESGIWESKQPNMVSDSQEDLIAVCKGDRRRLLRDESGSRHPQSAQRRLERYLRNIRVPVETRAPDVSDEWIAWFRPEADATPR